MKKLEDKEEVVKIAESFLSTQSTVPLGVSFLLEGSNIWLVFYNSKDYLETGVVHAGVLGNIPYLLDKNTREFLPTEHDERIYEFLLDYKRKKGYPTKTELMRIIDEKTRDLRKKDILNSNDTVQGYRVKKKSYLSKLIDLFR